MNDRLSTSLGDIQKTLILPLWGRAVETKKPEPLLVDEIAAQVIQKIDYDFSEVEKNLSVVSQVGWIARSYHVDSMTRFLIQKHPAATTVNIGCGLDTTCDRLDIFPGGELIFDASSQTGINISNRMVIQAGGMDEKSFLKWGIKDAKLLESWDSRIKLLNQYAMFHNLKNNFSFKGKIMARMSDMLKIQYMIHLNFLEP